jgi:hypothetical protein
MRHGIRTIEYEAFLSASRRLLSPFRAPVMVKLRSQCCAHPDVVLSACQNKPKVIFITRNFVDWGVSCSRKLGFTPEQNAMRIQRALTALGKLRSRADVFLLDYEDTSKPETYILIAHFLGIPIETNNNLVGTLLHDSQAGTALERASASEPELNALRQAHIAIWKSLRSSLPFPADDIALFEP